jgi:erythromycin esterase
MSWIRCLANCCVWIVLLFAQSVYSQDNRLAEQIGKVAIHLDSSVLSRSEPFNLRNETPSDFKVLGIGEQSHGTSEFFKARMSLIKSLLKYNKLTKIGLEAPFAEVEKLNSYILHDKGDLREILRSFRLFNYECNEFVDLVEGVKLLNGSSRKPITFFGADMQSPFQALQNLSELCKSGDRAAADSIKMLIEYYRALDNQIYNHSFSRKDFTELSGLSDRILKYLSGNKSFCIEKDFIQKNITNYKQFLLLNNPANAYETQATLRDSLMAENIISELKSGDKIVVLAHNGHVQSTPNVYSRSMGYFLSRRLGVQYQCIGLTTSTGYYTAFTPAAGKITNKNRIPVGEAGTFEYEFSKTGEAVFFFNTSTVRKHHVGGVLPDKYKLLPFGLVDQPFISSNLLEDFNYVLHIEKTFGNKSFYLK